MSTDNLSGPAAKKGLGTQAAAVPAGSLPDDGIPAQLFVPCDRSELDAEQIVRPSESYWKGVWRRITHSPLAVFCACLLLALVLLAVFAPVFSPYEYDRTSLTEGNLGPCAAHWFGTDSAGRDLWTRVWVGARVSLAVSICA